MKLHIIYIYVVCVHVVHVHTRYAMHNNYHGTEGTCNTNTEATSNKSNNE